MEPLRLDPVTSFLASFYFQGLLTFACAVSAILVRGESTLRWLTAASLLATLGGMVLLLRAYIPLWLSIELGNAIILVAGGVMIAACRSLGGLRPSWSLILLPAALWLVLCQIPAVMESAPIRVALNTGAGGVLSAWAAIALLQSDRTLAARWPAIIMGFVHAAFFLCRAVLAGMLPFPMGGLDSSVLNAPWTAIITAESVFFAFIMTFSIIVACREQAELHQRSLAETDVLTGLSTRRLFLASAQLAMQKRGARRDRPLSLIIFDLDHFKRINDTAGHSVGDKALVLFAQAARSIFGTQAEFGRLGGEEFAVLSRTNEESAARMAEQVREAYTASSRPLLSIPATVSAGVCGITPEAMLTDALAAADSALYAAKRAGRNRVMAHKQMLAMLPGSGVHESAARALPG